ncbi:MAG: hypothetical protein KGY45_01090 [Hadesarchaea archaeon]|nr:hypothetical protein [Hadesarchaea archaeon]
MLSQHCPNCKTPLFEYEEEKICPICGGKVVEEKKSESEVNESKKKEVEAKKIENNELSQLSEVTKNKLMNLKNKLESEDDPKKINEILKAIKSTLDVLKKLEKR